MERKRGRHEIGGRALAGCHLGARLAPAVRLLRNVGVADSRQVGQVERRPSSRAELRAAPRGARAALGGLDAAARVVGQQKGQQLRRQRERTRRWRRTRGQALACAPQARSGEIRRDQARSHLLLGDDGDAGRVALLRLAVEARGSAVAFAGLGRLALAVGLAPFTLLATAHDQYVGRARHPLQIGARSGRDQKKRGARSQRDRSEIGQGSRGGVVARLHDHAAAPLHERLHLVLRVGKALLQRAAALAHDHHPRQAHLRRLRGRCGRWEASPR